jgi:pimeloyl-ACP methyl ester carboxylesterase
VSGSPSEARRELVTSFDGTTIAARYDGRGDETPLVIANAVGADLVVWRPALDALRPNRPVVTWDLRGLHDSGPPASDRRDPGAHAQDGIAVLDHLGIERFAVAAWSSGCRIAVQIAHEQPERVASLVLVCGGAGHGLTRALRYLEPASLLPSFVGVAKHFSTYLGGAFRAVTSRPELAGLVRQSGMIGPTADVPILVEMLKGMATCDMRELLASYEALAGDAAPELLCTIQAPTLLVAGGRDQFTSLRVMQDMASAVPGAELEVYDEATHYLPIEFPERLGHDLQRWLTNHDAAR